MRQLYLINQAGESFDLNVEKHKFLNVGGLGHSSNNNYISLGSAFALDYNEIEQGKIVGDLLFMELNTAEEDYKDFVDFVEGALDLRIRYIPAPGMEYFSDVDFSYVSKGGEIDYSKMALVCTLAFVQKTSWYKAFQAQAQFGAIDTHAIRYPFRYPMRYVKYPGSFVDLYITGHQDAEIRLVANGTIVDPVVELINLTTGNTIAKMALSDVTIGSGEQLIFSTRETAPEISKVATNGSKTDISNLVDLQNENFFLVPKRTQCRIVFSSLGTTPPADLTVYDFYKSV